MGLLSVGGRISRRFAAGVTPGVERGDSKRLGKGTHLGPPVSSAPGESVSEHKRPALASRFDVEPAESL